MTKTQFLYIFKSYFDKNIMFHFFQCWFPCIWVFAWICNLVFTKSRGCIMHTSIQPKQWICTYVKNKQIISQFKQKFISVFRPHSEAETFKDMVFVNSIRVWRRVNSVWVTKRKIKKREKIWKSYFISKNPLSLKFIEILVTRCGNSKQ